MAKSPYVDQKDPPALQLRHDMARAKISGYLEGRTTVLNRYPASDNSLPARYARAIARNCSGKCDQAMGEVDALIKEKPDNPYFWEIKGSFYYWSGKHREAIPSLRKALQLAGGNESLIQVELAQAMLATEDASLLDEAMSLLRRAILTDPTHAPAHHQLATAFYRKGQYPAGRPCGCAGAFRGRQCQAGANVCRSCLGQTAARHARMASRRRHNEIQSAEDIVKYKGLACPFT